MSVSLSPLFNGYQSFLTTGLPNNGGFIYTYAAGSTTPQPTYTTNTGAIANANPIPLGADGRPPQEIWLTDGSAYKFVLTDALLNILPSSTFDNLYGIINTNSASGASLLGGGAQIVSSVTGLRGLLKTSASATAITTGYYLAGDGGGSVYYYDSTDTTTADNGGSIIVATDGGRWKISTSAPYSIKQFGGKADGSTDNSAAFAAAVTALGAAGGTILIPNGTFNVSAFPVLDNKIGITFQGIGGLGPNALQSRIVLTQGTAAACISAKFTQGIQFRDLIILTNNSLQTGYMFDFQGSAGIISQFSVALQRCSIGGDTIAKNINTLINLDKCINMTFRDVVMYYAVRAIIGQNPVGGSFSNTIKLDRIFFQSFSAVPVYSCGTAWTFDSCVWEPLTSGVTTAVQTLSSAITQSLVFINPWCGDGTAGGGIWFNFVGTIGITIIGGQISANSSAIGQGITFDACSAINVIGTQFTLIANGITFLTPCTGIKISCDFSANCPLPINGAVPARMINADLSGCNPSQTLQFITGTSCYRYHSDGMLEQWGQGTTTANVQSISFAKTFSVITNVQITSGANTSVWETVPTTTGFTANSGATAVSYYWRAIGTA